MTHEQIAEIIDSSVKKMKRTGLIITICGAAVLLPGAGMFFAGKGDVHTGGLVMMCAGGFFLLIGLLMWLSKSTERTAEYVKDALKNNPKELVWVYVHETKQYGKTVSSELMIKFRNGKWIGLNDSLLPGKDTMQFMRVLKGINPEVNLGYSKELEYKFNKRTL